ncbi:MAG: septation regulator SpoVG [Oscillospiraceae bacterium]|nr:septation regulator SpoVG [Oscillospiraceae bacterium]
MEITDLKIRKMMTEGRLRAIVSITLDQMLAVHDIKVVQGEERLFVAMPSRKDEAGIFRDIVHPITPTARQYFETQILEAYSQQLALMQAETFAAVGETPAASESEENIPDAE